MGKVTTRPATDRGAFMRQLDAELQQDPEFARRVETLLDEIRIEQAIAALRQERGVSQVELAKRLGVTQPAIAKLESGKVRNMELRTLVKLAAALGARVKVTLERAEAGGRRARGKRKTAAA